MILILKVFRRLFNFFNAIFRQETSTALQQKSICLPFIAGNIFLPIADDQMFPVFVSKV